MAVESIHFTKCATFGRKSRDRTSEQAETSAPLKDSRLIPNRKLLKNWQSVFWLPVWDGGTLLCEFSFPQSSALLRANMPVGVFPPESCPTLGTPAKSRLEVLRGRANYPDPSASLSVAREELDFAVEELPGIQRGRRVPTFCRAIRKYASTRDQVKQP